MILLGSRRDLHVCLRLCSVSDWQVSNEGCEHLKGEERCPRMRDTLDDRCFVLLILHLSLFYCLAFISVREVYSKGSIIISTTYVISSRPTITAPSAVALVFTCYTSTETIIIKSVTSCDIITTVALTLADYTETLALQLH